MEQRYQVFITTAETLSMKRTAEIHFVSHQCISSHIKNLEKEFGTALFIRKPHLMLTAEGHLLLERLYEIRRMERDMFQVVSGNKETVTGMVSLGIPASRYNPLAADVLAAVSTNHPGIRLEILYDFSSVLESYVEKGVLDMAITFFQPENNRLAVVPLYKEYTLFVISRQLINQMFHEQADDFIKGHRAGVTPREIAQFPIVQYPYQSRIRSAFENYSKNTGTNYEIIFETNRCDTLVNIAKSGIAGCIIPSIYLEAVAQSNLCSPPRDHIFAFPINISEMPSMNQMTKLIYSNQSTLTTLKHAVLESIVSLYERYGEDISQHNAL